MSNEPLSTGESRPTDLELMLYADGELDEPRRAAVEAWLRRDAVGRRKLASLRVGGRLVRDAAIRRAARGVDIADAVMAKLDAPARAPYDVADEVMAKLDAPPRAEAPRASESASSASNVIPLRRPQGEGRAEPRSPEAPKLAAVAAQAPKPASEKPRAGRIFALAGTMLAAAAALALWMHSTPSPQPTAQNIPTATNLVDPRGELPSPNPSPNGLDPANDGEVEPAVEVAAVDFGARMGAIFYVPSGAAASHQTTTVVWLNDDAAGGE